MSEGNKSLWSNVTFCFLLSYLMVNTASAKDVSSKEGEYSVASGAASYTIPIKDLPGPRDMQPKHSIDYSSRSGNGHLALGWSIGDVSFIKRCLTTKDHDGHGGSVNLEADNRYCIGANRLITVNGSYGANGTEYRIQVCHNPHCIDDLINVLGARSG
jgi:hypothetical protein